MHRFAISLVVFGAISFIGRTSTSPVHSNEPFALSIIHINDLHARFEETNEYAGNCKANDTCIGGYGRAVTIIKGLMDTRPNHIYLNAGDSFQGTMWYTLGRWNVTSELFNVLDADAMTLGNHDFDDGIDGVVPFMETLNTPIVLANVDDTLEPTFQHKYQRSLVIERDGRKIGIIGVILADVNRLANTGRLKFIDEITAIRREATKLKEQNVNIIIVVSHCGLNADYVIAKACAEDVDVIVGGHSHSFMYTSSGDEHSPGPDTVVDNYPAVVHGRAGHKVLIVQAAGFSKYVGDLTVYFDRSGRAVRWEGAPIYLDNAVVQDADVIAALQPWKQMIDHIGAQVISEIDVPLEKVPCHSHECKLGDLLADAFVDFYHGNDIAAHSPELIAFITCGTIHASLEAGPITFNDLRLILPFDNTIDTFELRGDHIRAVFEHAVDASWRENTFIGKWLIQVSGLRVTYNMSMPVNNRVVSIESRRINKSRMIEYQIIDHDTYYLCAAQSFLVAGGDGYEMIKMHKRNHRPGPTDIDAIFQYFKKYETVEVQPEGRLVFLD